MIFGKKPQNQMSPMAANRLVNRILTYGLMFFIIYALYNSDHRKKNMTIPLAASEINYTPVDFGNYLRVKDLSSKREYGFELDASPHIQLTKEKNNAPLFELEFSPKQSCDIIINDNHVASFPRER